MHVYGGQIAQILALLWNNYEKIYFHTRTTYISSPGRPSQSSNLSLVRRFRNERTKIITNWKEKHKETLVDSLKWILSQGLHKQHQMRKKINFPLPIAKMLRRFTNKYRTQASDLLLQVLSLLLFNRHNLEHSEQWNYSHFFSIPTLTNYGSFPSPYPLDKEQRKKKSLIATVYVVVIVIIIIIIIIIIISSFLLLLS